MESYSLDAASICTNGRSARSDVMEKLCDNCKMAKKCYKCKITDYSLEEPVRIGWLCKPCIELMLRFSSRQMMGILPKGIPDDNPGVM
jgi:hypothetical protein